MAALEAVGVQFSVTQVMELISYLAQQAGAAGLRGITTIAIALAEAFQLIVQHSHQKRLG